MSAKAELEAIRAEIANRAKARAAAEAASADDAELAAAKRQLADEEAYDKAVSEHGASNIERVETVRGLVIVKRPPGALFRKFADSEKSDTLAAEQFVMPCRVYPSAEVFGRWIDETPGIIVDLVLACSALAGSKKAAQLKK
jgi:hypothetical protein